MMRLGRATFTRQDDTKESRKRDGKNLHLKPLPRNAGVDLEGRCEKEASSFKVSPRLEAVY